jgi:hypothetical protein
MRKSLIFVPFLIGLLSASISSATPVDPSQFTEAILDKNICPGDPMSTDRFLALLNQDTGKSNFETWVYQRNRLRIGDSFGLWKPLLGSSYVGSIAVDLTLAIKDNSARATFNYNLITFDWKNNQRTYGETLTCDNPLKGNLKWKYHPVRFVRWSSPSFFNTLNVVDSKITNSCIWVKFANDENTSERYIYYTFD